jgi:hypothetical protein
LRKFEIDLMDAVKDLQKRKWICGTAHTLKDLLNPVEVLATLALSSPVVWWWDRFRSNSDCTGGCWRGYWRWVWWSWWVRWENRTGGGLGCLRLHAKALHRHWRWWCITAGGTEAAVKDAGTYPPSCWWVSCAGHSWPVLG